MSEPHILDEPTGYAKDQPATYASNSTPPCPETVEVPKGWDLVSRKAVVALCDQRASEHADMALAGEPANARSRESMEAAFRSVQYAVAFMPSASGATVEAFSARPTTAEPAEVPVEQTLVDLRLANLRRDMEWNTGKERVSLAFRGVELAGEVGELCNLLKKIERERIGIVGSRASLDDVAAELADVVICVDLIAMDLNISLARAVPAKFDATSEKYGLATRLSARPTKTETGVEAVRKLSLERLEEINQLNDECGAKHREIATLRAQLAEAERLRQNNFLLANKWRLELDAITAAIGSVEFMDPPDGGDVSLSEQVRRMRAALAEAKERAHYAKGVADLAMKHRDEAEARIAELEAGLRTAGDAATKYETHYEDEGVPVEQLTDDIVVEAHSPLGFLVPLCKVGDLRKARALLSAAEQRSG